MSNTEIKKLINQENLNRGFTHLTIPAEIWLREDISLHAKCLWSELRSLHDKERGGCYASEDYLCKFMQLKRSRFHEVLKELKDAGLMEVVSFDGRSVVRRAIVPPVEYFESGDPPKNPNNETDCGQQLSGIPDTCCPENRTPQVRKTGHLKADPPAPPYKEYIENKEESVCKKGAKAPTYTPNVDASFSLKFGKFVSLERLDYETLCSKHGKALIDQYIDKINDHCSSIGKVKYKDYAATIRNWIRGDESKKKITPMRKYEDPKAAIRERQMREYIAANGEFDATHVFD